MKKDPLQKCVAVTSAGGNTENDVDKFFLTMFEYDSVQCKKNQHGMRADALVAIDKWVIFDKTIAKPRSLLLYRRINIDTGKALERCGKGRFQQSFVPKSGGTAGFSDELLMQK